MSDTRLIAVDDAVALAELARANRAFMAPWEPLPAEDYFTGVHRR
ncbi:hypothetical protein [Phytohabitans rumicis]|nr:hypothetical protein [Phytohabitans rumicis]